MKNRIKLSSEESHKIIEPNPWAIMDHLKKSAQDLRDTLDLLDEMRGRFLVRDNDIKTRVNNHLKKFK